MLHTIAIKLKIPDNTAYSALTALRRLGVDVTAVERADIWQFAGPGSDAEVAESVKRNELLFNVNKHVLDVLPSSEPRPGEAWVCGNDDPEKAPARHYVGWRLFDNKGKPVKPAVVKDAVEKLLCNPAIERAIL